VGKVEFSGFLGTDDSSGVERQKTSMEQNLETLTIAAGKRLYRINR